MKSSLFHWFLLNLFTSVLAQSGSNNETVIFLNTTTNRNQENVTTNGSQENAGAVLAAIRFGADVYNALKPEYNYCRFKFSGYPAHKHNEGCPNMSGGFFTRPVVYDRVWMEVDTQLGKNKRCIMRAVYDKNYGDFITDDFKVKGEGGLLKSVRMSIDSWSCTNTLSVSCDTNLVGEANAAIEFDTAVIADILLRHTGSGARPCGYNNEGWTHSSASHEISFVIKKDAFTCYKRYENADKVKQCIWDSFDIVKTENVAGRVCKDNQEIWEYFGFRRCNLGDLRGK